MKKKVTIKDVAREAGVSITTVSLILNGNAHKFNKDTVAKVLRIKTTLGYEADYFAQRMITKKSKTIGVIIPDITNPFFSRLVQGIEEVFYRENFMTILCIPELDKEKERNYLDELSRRGVDGFIIASSAISNEEIDEALVKKNHPFIVLDQKSFRIDSDVVLTDDYDGGKQAATHLQELGHNEIAVVMPQNATSNIQKRLEGFLSVYNRPKIIYANLSKNGGITAVPEILESSVTAIFAINDEIAFGIYYGMRNYNKVIPDDYSVIGYDNVEMCQYVEPQLTTINQPMQELGTQTAELLLRKILTPEKKGEKVFLQVELIQRSSTAPLINK